MSWQEEHPPWTIHDAIGQNGGAVGFDDQLGNQHLIYLHGHQQQIPWDCHTLLFHSLEGHALGVKSNVFPIGSGNGMNVGCLLFPSLEIGLSRSLLFFGALAEVELETGSRDADFLACWWKCFTLSDPQ